MRHNPPLDTDKDGYLINAQFSKWGNENFPNAKGYNPNATLWLHSTNARSVDQWLDNFRPQTDHRVGRGFFIGAGDNIEYGDNLIFFRYKPTKIFDYTNDQHIDSIWNCVWRKIKKDPSLIDYIYGRVDYDYLRKKYFSESQKYSKADLIHEEETHPQNESIIKEAFRFLFSLGNYDYLRTFEDCIMSQRYTSYYEVEELHGKEGSKKEFDPSRVNIRIFESDFDNIEIVGLLKSHPKLKSNRMKELRQMRTEQMRLGYDMDRLKWEEILYELSQHRASGWYTCPVCEDIFHAINKKSVVEDIIKSGKIACPSCTYSDVF